MVLWVCTYVIWINACGRDYQRVLRFINACVHAEKKKEKKEEGALPFVTGWPNFVNADCLSCVHTRESRCELLLNMITIQETEKVAQSFSCPLEGGK